VRSFISNGVKKMSKARKSFAIVGLASAMAFAGPALAQDTGFYAGIHIGQASAKDGCEGAGALGVSCDDEDTAFKILGGYQFNKNFAVELGYTDFGEVSGAGGGNSFSTEATAFELVAVGMLPLADKFSVYGKIGMYRGDVDTSGTGIFGSASESNTDLTFAVGVRYDFTRNLGVRAEWQKYQDVGGGDIGESDVDVLSIGAIWKF
jgi:OmpA-OmpF porin, OOP family